MHTSKTSMNHPDHDGHVVPDGTGHSFRVQADNLGGAEMAIAACQDEPGVVDRTAWGEWLPFIPGDTKRKTREICKPMIKESAKQCVDISNEFLEGWFKEKLCLIGSLVAMSNARKLAESHLITTESFPRRQELINCDINSQNFGAYHKNHLVCAGCRQKHSDKVFDECNKETVAGLKDIDKISEKMDKWNHYCVATTQIVGENEAGNRLRGGQNI
jgi:hypothetical protein